MSQFRNIEFSEELRRKLLKALDKKYRSEAEQKMKEIISVIEDVQNALISNRNPSANKWNHLQGNAYEIMPFGHKSPERLFCYKKTGSEDYVIVDFDLIKKHKRIQGKYRKNILKKGKTYFGE